MKRRAPGVDSEIEVPGWVLDGASCRAAMRRLTGGSGSTEEFHAERHRARAAAEAWCAERGLSFSMTVLGGHRPSTREVAAGNTKGAGPKYAAAMRWEAEHRR